MPTIVLVLVSNFSLIFNCDLLLVNVGNGSWLVGLSMTIAPRCFVVQIHLILSLIYSHSNSAMQNMLAELTDPLLVVQILLILLGKSTWVPLACCSNLWSLIWLAFTPHWLCFSNTTNECNCSDGTCPAVSRIPHPPVNCHCPCSPVNPLTISHIPSHHIEPQTITVCYCIIPTLSIHHLRL